jgi:hypothetical protein
VLASAVVRVLVFVELGMDTAVVGFVVLALDTPVAELPEVALLPELPVVALAPVLLAVVLLLAHPCAGVLELGFVELALDMQVVVSVVVFVALVMDMQVVVWVVELLL